MEDITKLKVLIQNMNANKFTVKNQQHKSSKLSIRERLLGRKKSHSMNDLCKNTQPR